MADMMYWRAAIVDGVEKQILVDEDMVVVGHELIDAGDKLKAEAPTAAEPPKDLKECKEPESK